MDVDFLGHFWLIRLYNSFMEQIFVVAKGIKKAAV